MEVLKYKGDNYIHIFPQNVENCRTTCIDKIEEKYTIREEPSSIFPTYGYTFCTCIFV